MLISRTCAWSMQFFFCHQKERKVKLDKVREGLRPITLRFRANAQKLILGSIGTPLDHLRVKPKLCFINMIIMSYCGKSHWNGVKSSLLTKF